MIEYRKATVNDIEELLRVRIDFLRNAKNIRNENDEIDLLKSNREFLMSSLSTESYVQWLAIIDGKIVATSSVSIYLLPPNTMRLNGKVAYIGNMFTYPEYRKQGIATKLFSITVDTAKNSCCNEILLIATDMGRPIYEKYGFIKADDAMHYFVL